MGIGTVLADDPQLTTRLARQPSKDPIRVILDSHLRTPATAVLLNLNSPAPTWIATTPTAPTDKIKAMEALGVEVLVMPEVGGRVALEPLLQESGPPAGAKPPGGGRGRSFGGLLRPAPGG